MKGIARLRERGLGRLLAMALLVLLVVAEILRSTPTQGQGVGNFSGDMELLGQGWTAETSQGAIPAALPQAFEETAVFTLRRTLPRTGDYATAPALLFQAKYFGLAAFLDGEEIYRYTVTPGPSARTTGMRLLMVQLPAQWQGRELQLEITPLLGDSVSYELRAPALGEKADLLLWVMRGDAGDFVVAALLLALGCMLVLSQLFVRQRIGLGQELFCLGALAMLFALYIFCQMNAAHLLLSNNYALYVTEFTSLALLPLPALMLAKSNADPRFGRLLHCVMAAVLLNFLGQLLLHCLTALEYRQMLLATHTAVLVSACALGLTLALTRGKQYPRKKELLLAFAPLIAGGVTDLARFYLQPGYALTRWFKAGMVAFVLLEAYFNIRRYLLAYADALKSELYKKMAFTDALTGLPNRAAYENALKQVRHNPAAFAGLYCFSADVNNLKEVNDTQGHQAGDALLIHMAETLRKAVEPGQDELIFRVGGDEFMLLLPGHTAESARALGLRLRREAAKIEGPPLSFSLGWAAYRPAEGKLEHAISLADARMYQNKAEMKRTFGLVLEDGLEEGGQ